MRDNEVFSVLEDVYSRKQYIGKGKRSRKYKKYNSWVWEKDRYRG